MRLARSGFLALGIGLLLIIAACGRKTRPSKRASAQEETTATLAPTPDNTPIEVLRTPAGLVLKPGAVNEPALTPSPAQGAP